jgi:hypothetical protein
MRNMRTGRLPRIFFFCSLMFVAEQGYWERSDHLTVVVTAVLYCTSLLFLTICRTRYFNWILFTYSSFLVKASIISNEIFPLDPLKILLDLYPRIMELTI